MKDKDGQGILDATVLIVEGPDHYDIAALTDEDGHFSFNDLRPGRYSLQVNAGFASQTTQCEVKAGQITELEFLLPKR